MSNETIQLRNLSIGYSQKKGVRKVLTGINASLKSGELTCLIGSNGIGKSTLLRTLSAFLPPLSGDIIIDGRSIGEYTDKELSRKISVVLTEKPEIQNMTARELVSLGRSPYTGFWGNCSADDMRIVDKALYTMGISSLSGRYVDTLSDGERQKVMIAKALAQQTPVIFLDEPTAFLDFPSKVEVMRQLKQIAREIDKTISLSTHDLELALQIADIIWLISRNNSIEIGSPQQLAADGRLSAFFEGTGINIEFKDNSPIRIII